jgi:hypothetical protein
MSAKGVYHRGGAVPAVRLEPPGKSHLQRLAYIFNTPQNIGRAQLMCGMSSGVHGPAHLTYLMGPTLERRHALANKTSHYVLRCEADIPQFALNPVDGINRPHSGLRVIRPILHPGGWLIHVWRQVEQIHICCVLHVEETLLLFFIRLEQLYLGEV